MRGGISLKPKVCLFFLQFSRKIDMDGLRQPETVTGIALIQNLTSAIWIRYTYMMVNCKFGGYE